MEKIIFLKKQENHHVVHNFSLLPHKLQQVKALKEITVGISSSCFLPSYFCVLFA